MSTTPQDPYGTGDDDRDRSSGSTPPPYGSPPPPPSGDDRPPAYGGDSSGGDSSGYGSTPYGSTPPAYGSSSYGGAPPAYGGSDYGTSQSPYGYGYPKNSLAVWSLVLGLVGIFVCGLFTGIPAIVVGHKARGAVAEGQANNGGMATAGIVLGWIATILSIVGVAIVIGLIASGSMTSFENVDPNSF
jgi:hypothetical protein